VRIGKIAALVPDGYDAPTVIRTISYADTTTLPP
jgi:hypothetical protein